MKEKNSRVSTAFTRTASRAICGLLAVTIAIPLSPVTYAGDNGLENINPSSISRGDTASALPDVKKICDAVESAQAGTFATKSGIFMGTAPECASRTRRQRETAECKIDLGGQALAGLSGDALQSKIDSLCGQSSGLSHDAAVYCALRNATKGGQALQYCSAYVAADKAQNGLKTTLYFDLAAAGICYGEYIAILLSKSSTKAYRGYACGGAAMAAVLSELVQTASILGKSRDAYCNESEKVDGKCPLSHDKSGGNYKIDSSNRVVERGNLAKALEITASSTLSATAFYMALCYYDKDKSGLCGTFSHTKNSKIADARKRVLHATSDDRDAAQKSNNALVSKGTVQRVTASAFTGVDMTTDSDKEDVNTWQINRNAIDNKFDKLTKQADELNAQAQIALRTAMIFTALAGMRGIASSTAGKTKNDAETILQSLFTPNGNPTNFGASGTVGYQSSIFTSTGVNAFSSTTNDGSTKSASTAAAADPSDSAFLAPPGSPLNQKAGAIAAAMPVSAKNGDMSTAAGLGAGIAAAATAAGVPASALGEIRSHVDSIFANLPKEEGGYGGSSGGGLAKKSDSGGGMDGLNLKGLFGGQEKEQSVGGNESLAYRGLASDDIWHSRNPKGNNLFQIVSDRYDTAQRKQEMGN